MQEKIQKRKSSLQSFFIDNVNKNISLESASETGRGNRLVILAQSSLFFSYGTLQHDLISFFSSTCM